MDANAYEMGFLEQNGEPYQNEYGNNKNKLAMRTIRDFRNARLKSSIDLGAQLLNPNMITEVGWFVGWLCLSCLFVAIPFSLLPLCIFLSFPLLFFSRFTIIGLLVVIIVAASIVICVVGFLKLITFLSVSLL